MKCPFLTKINFKKVSQVVSEDSATQQVKQWQNEHFLPLEGEQQNFDLSDQSIQNINSFGLNRYNINYFNCKINIPQSSNHHLEIKFPKQLQIKPMISRNQQMELEQQNHNCQLINESLGEQTKNVPHHLISKMSMMSNKCQDIFYGEVILEEENQNYYQCEIKDKIVRFTRQGKIKYYIEMSKVKCTIQNIRDNHLVLNAICKNNGLNLKVTFPRMKKLNCFVKAVELNNIEINQSRQIEEFIIKDQLNASYSLDSLGLEVQRMNFEDLKETGDTFDVILFKNRTMMSKVQRILTNSDYDHVAMLIKASNNDLFILESSSNLGVSVYTLKSLIDLPRKKYYFRVAIRKYQGEKTYEQLVKVQQFIRQAIGKKYKFDPMYLLSSNVKKGDTYFCSELVSQALQKAGIMSASSPSYRYLPKHFAQDGLNEHIEKGLYSDIIILQ